MTEDLGELSNNLFHGCALAAFVDQASLEGGWPDPERTRRRAYAYYEAALAAEQESEVRHRAATLDAVEDDHEPSAAKVLLPAT